MNGWLTPWRQALSLRSRECRDTLFLLAVLGWTLLPQISQVPAWCTGLAYAALAWRARMAWRGDHLPSRWHLALALLGAVLGTVFSHQSLISPAAGLTLLVVLAALKTLELRARRDATVAFFIGFFLVLANFLTSQSLLLTLAMAVSVWTLLAALVLAHMPVGRPPLWQVLGISARLLLAGLPLVVVLFLLFPRIDPLWGIPTPGTARTGLSDHLELGGITNLAKDDSIAMRLQFEGGTPLPEMLYFRGPVLSEPDGNGWRQRLWRPGMPVPRATTVSTPHPNPALASTGASTGTGTTTAPRAGYKELGLVRYEMTVEPLNITTLPLLEHSLTGPMLDSGMRPIQWHHHGDGIWSAERPISERLRVQGQALLGTAVHDVVLKQAQTRPQDSAEVIDPRSPLWLPYTHLPAENHQRTRAWAAQWRQQLPNPVPTSAPVLVQALLTHIRQQPYHYTLTPGAPGTDPIDAFWLEHRRGFCEHYASSMVVILRSWGIPARLVTGYQGGKVNPINGVLEVRQSDAHAWVEYWYAPRGWTRVDPTAAVAPERIQHSERLSAPNSLMGNTVGRLDPAMLARMQAVWSAMEHHWNQWILGYSAQGQMDLLQQLGWSLPDITTLSKLLAGCLVGLALVVIVPAWWRAWARQRQDAWLHGYRRIGLALTRQGLVVAEHWPPQTLAHAVIDHWGHTDSTARLSSHLQALADWRYANTDSTGTRPSTGLSNVPSGNLNNLIGSALSDIAALPALATPMSTPATSSTADLHRPT